MTVGKKDLELSTKMADGRWRYQPLPSGLPKINLEATGRPSLTSSPPPGRPDRIQEDRKRQYSGSDIEESIKKCRADLSSKANKQGDRMSDKEGELILNTGVAEIDPGSFTNQEAYCPQTPAKTKQILELSTYSSPVFHSRARDTTA